MSVTVVVPEEYGYVVATTAFTFFLGLWHGARARPFRTKVKIWAPKAYADTADVAAAKPEQKDDLYLFNCAQRAHANYVENQPSTAIAILLAGLRYPRLSTLLGAGWILGRIIFAIGYTQKKKENGSGRMLGFAIQFPMQLSLWALAGWTGIRMLP
ncbi:glutation S-transferase [Lecanosticta acicola]|uniref:Glutation S-transferase n=1 Tax=Lecanosticta acicola TaxID=111012 RepID=A0AAI9EFK2_9PEZI|nr:glutation S-transferase [Lecanosticta acicola]